jgi:hypothetical protein
LRVFASGDAYPTCDAVACRMVVGRRASMGEAGFRHYLQLQARHKQQLAAHTAATAARRLTEAADNDRAWTLLQRLAGAPGNGAPDALRLALPSGPRRARPLAFVRRERYRLHLQALVADAAALASGGSSDIACDTAAVASTMPGQLCALCGGGCCTRGGDHAYLSAATLRRFMDAQPALSGDAVVSAYLDRITSTTQAGSCINHTRAGCSLLREMRSDICNRFACAPLARVLASQRGEQPVQVVLVVRRAQDHWRRAEPMLPNGINGAAVLRESGVQRMSAGLLAPCATGTTSA